MNTVTVTVTATATYTISADCQRNEVLAGRDGSLERSVEFDAASIIAEISLDNRGIPRPINLTTGWPGGRRHEYEAILTPETALYAYVARRTVIDAEAVLEAEKRQSIANENARKHEVDVAAYIEACNNATWETLPAERTWPEAAEATALLKPLQAKPTRGGKREGSGRKRLDPSLRRWPITFNLTLAEREAVSRFVTELRCHVQDARPGAS